MRVKKLRLLKKLAIWIAICLYFFLVIFSIFNFNGNIYYTLPISNRDTSFNKSICQIDYEALQSDVEFDDDDNILHISDLKFDFLSSGGCRKTICIPLQKVAIIIPFRDRHCHLMKLLKRLHILLNRQNVYYRIFLIEQVDSNAFNRGRLLNVGVLESLKFEAFDCFILHDVDLLPEDARNLYYCSQHMHHLISALDENRYHIMYNNYMGGVVAVPKSNIWKTNGHSNLYWGWGNEDDDFSARVGEANLFITRPPEYIGRYKMIRHVKNYRSNSLHNLFLTWRSRWKWDGLNSLANSDLYQVVSITEFPLYTNVSVSFPPMDESEILKLETAQGESIFWFLRFYFL